MDQKKVKNYHFFLFIGTTFVPSHAHETRLYDNMKKFLFVPLLFGGVITASAAPYPEMKAQPDTVIRQNEAVSDTAVIPLTLEDALKIALSENTSVKVAEKEISRSEYARKGSYAALFPQIDATASYQRTLKKQVMYMDFDMGGGAGGGEDVVETPQEPGASDGFEVGRSNNWTLGVSAGMPLVSTALWKSLSISDLDVELAVEKARSSKLAMVTQVKQAFYSVLLAEESLKVFQETYDNALKNYEETKKKFMVDKASEYDLIRAEVTVRNAEPNVYNAQHSLFIANWQLKAVIGIDLDTEIECVGALGDFADDMFREYHSADTSFIDNNASLREFAIQLEQLSETVKMQKYQYIPTLSLSFSYNYISMNNDFKFAEYRWNPYSTIGLTLSVPIFSGGARYHNVKQAQVSYESAKLQRDDLERNIRISIRQYLGQMETCMKKYYAAQSSVSQARKGYEIAEKMYQVGKNTLIDVNDANLALASAQLNTNQAVYEFITAKAQLEELIGDDSIIYR